MPIRKYKPTSPGVRSRKDLYNPDLSENAPLKSLTGVIKRTGGRNSNGRITSRFRGGGHKRIYRIIDFKRDKVDVPSKVNSLEYDPNRNANIALLHYADGEKRYILAPVGLKVGDTVVAGAASDIKPGNSLPLKNIPLGTIIHNIEMKVGKGGQMVRSAGAFAQLMAKEGEFATLKMPSSEVRMVRLGCFATIGQVGNTEFENIVYGKAGRRRWLGRNPHVRGMCMNPVDHPHGGGEGRSKGGNHPQSPWGQPAKGYKTRTNKTSNRLIVKRRKKK